MPPEDPGRDVWIATHGSDRLRLALALGLAGQSLGVYRDERLAHELPGWQWADRGLDVSDVQNPSLAGLQALESTTIPCSHPADQASLERLLQVCPSCGVECSGNQIGDDDLCYDQSCPLHQSAGAVRVDLVKVRQESGWREALTTTDLPWAPGRRAFRLVQS